MSDKGLGRGAAGDRVQHRRLDLEIAARDEMAAQRRDDPAAPAQGLAAFGVHDQVEIALAIAQLDIGEAVVLLGQRPQGFGQHRNRRSVDRQFAARGAADEALDPDQVADIEQPNGCQPLRVEVVAVAEDLDLARGVVQVDEHAAVADCTDAPGNADALARLRARRQSRMPAFELCRLLGAGKCVRVRVDPERLQSVELGKTGGSQRIFGISSSRTPAAHPAAARETGCGDRSTTVSWKRCKVP